MIENAIEVTRLLVVSRDSAILRPLWSMGESNGWQLEIAANPWEAMDRAQSGAAPDLLLLDVQQGNGDGLHSLRWLRRLRPALPIIFIGHPDDAGAAEELIRMGARDYLLRPLDDCQLETVIRRNLSIIGEPAEADISSEDVESVGNDTFFIGASPIMRKLRAQMALLAETDASVLILGESGSGKETAARLIHRLSVRSGFGFSRVDCSALPGDLLERELFGYQKVSATAPTRTKIGKLELCASGTILLDEITDMPLSLQSNLLQVLQNKRFIRPGTSDFVEADVRILATCPTNVALAISENRLREDLYHHLSAYTINVPPLRERKEELPILSRHLMHRLAKHYGLSPREFSPEIIEAWKSYDWPANLRELEHCVKRYLMVGDKKLGFQDGRSDAEGESLDAAFPKPRTANQAASSSGQFRASPSASKSLRSLVKSVKAEAERNAIAVALEKTGWNRKAAARLLKVSYRTVLYKIDEYKMTSSDPARLSADAGPRVNVMGLRDNGNAD